MKSNDPSKKEAARKGCFLFFLVPTTHHSQGSKLLLSFPYSFPHGDRHPLRHPWIFPFREKFHDPSFSLVVSRSHHGALETYVLIPFSICDGIKKSPPFGRYRINC